MGSVKGEIDRIAGAKTDIKDAIEDCGVDVLNEDRIETYAGYIRDIPDAVFAKFNVPQVGNDNTYIKYISQTNGKISATTGDTTGTVTKDSAALITSGGVYNEIINYLPLSGGKMTGPIVFNGSDSDRYLIRVNNGSYDYDKVSAYGFTLKYLGASYNGGTGINNVLALYADNSTATSQNLSTVWLNNGNVRNRTIEPHTNDTYYLGNESLKWKNVYATTFTGNLDGNAASATKVSNSLTCGTKTYDGSEAVEIVAADLGLSAALKYIGITTTALTDDSTTQTISISGKSVKASNGDVAFYSDKEFVWNGSKWELLGAEATYKVLQTAVTSPTASTTATATAFIDTISQDKNGVITATKKPVTASALGIYKRPTYVNGATYNMAGTSNSDAFTIYAPTTAGTSNYVLKSKGSGAPEWTAQSNLSVGTAAKLGSDTLGSTTKPIYLSSGTATECNTYAGGTAVTLNGSSKASTTASFYAPTSSGTSGYLLKSNGSSAAPTWTNTIGSSTTSLSSSYITTMYADTLYLKSWYPTSGDIYISGFTTAPDSSDRVRLVTARYATIKNNNSSSACAIYAPGGFYESSDERLKNISNPLQVNLDDIAKLRKIYYTWKDSPNSNQIGVIAQDVQKLYPELVDVDKETGLLSLAYDKLSVIALAAIDTLYDKIKTLEEKIDILWRK